MPVTITVETGTAQHHFTCESDTLLAPLLKERGLLDFPCSKGKCGKCLIYANTPPSPEETARLSEQALANGCRLACFTRAAAGLVIRTPPRAALSVVSAFIQEDYSFVPVVHKHHCPVSSPPLKSKQTDIAHLLECTGCSNHTLSLHQMARLPYFLRGEPSATSSHSSTRSNTLPSDEEQQYVLTKGDTLTGFSRHSGHYAMVVDIGTTTVVATFFDLHTRQVVHVCGAQNSQSSFGADVISRIHHSSEAGIAPLHTAIINQLQGMLEEFLALTGADDISVLSITGNTTMMHFACGIPPEFIGKAPFTPVSTEPMHVSARELGFVSDAPAFLLPGVSGYIGADIIAALLAVPQHATDAPFLLIDFGTNAETVLYANGTYYCCSAAAGPCFEGATLSCGMTAQSGAISRIDCIENALHITTIDDQPAKGLCGSGIVDAMAVLLEYGGLDQTGKVTVPQNGPLAACMNEEKGLLLPCGVTLTQADIRAVQLAKAAVRAGVEVLCSKAKIRYKAIANVYIAGGFGSALRAQSAARIGLIPEQLADAVSVLGNAASFGALRYITEQGCLEKAVSIKERTEYVELAVCADFSGHYIEQMLFP